MALNIIVLIVIAIISAIISLSITQASEFWGQIGAWLMTCGWMFLFFMFASK